MANTNEQKCLICNSICYVKAVSYNGFQWPDTYTILECSRCNSSFSLPRTDASKLYDTIYSLGENVPEYKRYWEYEKKIKQYDNPLDYLTNSEEAYWCINYEINNVEKKYCRPGNIIEIGSGLGYLTYALNKSGYNTIGIDISEVVVNRARKNFGKFYEQANLFEYSKKNSSVFDMAILTEVIEHVENPIGFLNAALNLVKKNGTVILTTPNKSFFSKKSIWVSTPPPIHCYLFSEHSLSYIADRLEANIYFTDFSKYYKHKPLHINNKEWTTVGPVINEKNELINSNVKAQSMKQKNNFKKIIKKVLFVDSVRNVKKKLTHKKCGKRGIILGAVLKKK